MTLEYSIYKLFCKSTSEDVDRAANEALADFSGEAENEKEETEQGKNIDFKFICNFLDMKEDVPLAKVAKKLQEHYSNIFLLMDEEKHKKTEQILDKLGIYNVLSDVEGIERALRKLKNESK